MHVAGVLQECLGILATAYDLSGQAQRDINSQEIVFAQDIKEFEVRASAAVGAPVAVATTPAVHFQYCSSLNKVLCHSRVFVCAAGLVKCLLRCLQERPTSS